MVKSSLTVLIVDDIEPMRKVIAAQLGSLGIRSVYTAANGIEAMKVLHSHQIDLVLSDWNMPEMNGIALLAAMRADSHFERVPFIMITAEAERQRIDEAITQGVADLLVKPYTTGRLSLSLDRALLARRPRPAIAAADMAPPSVLAGMDADDAYGNAKDKLTILLVDDKPDNLHLLVNIFKDSYRILAADSGIKALELCCSDEPPDLVMLDVMMPGMDGFEVARRMREHPSAENIPVIFVTAMTDEQAQVQGLSLGAIDFVSKPVDPESIRLRVTNFMRYIRLRRELQADCDRMLDMARLREAADDMMRNDIQGPLTTVLTLLQGLMADKELLRRHNMQLENGQQAILRLLDMVHLSSELYRIESGRYVLEAVPVPIVDIVRRVVALARASFEQRKLTIAVDSDVDVGVEPPSVAGDAMLTFSLLQNIVRNACEASPDHGRVDVKLIDGDSVRVVIANKGAVPMQIRSRFFDKFTTWGKLGAAGLGAYSAQVMARAQRGEITLEVSDENNTSTLVISLPRDTSPN